MYAEEYRAVMPKIVLRQGRVLEFHKRLLSDTYVFSIPRNANSDQTICAYRHALSRAYIDAIERASPAHYDCVAETFSASHRATNRALERFFLTSNKSDDRTRAFCLRWFRYLNPMRIKAQSLGVTNFGDRSDWKDEAAALCAKIHERGYKTTRADITRQIGGTRRQLKATLNTRSFSLQGAAKMLLTGKADGSKWGAVRRQAVRKSQARLDALNAQLARLDTLQMIF